MAHYRNIEVNGVQYRYRVGPKTTKVQNRETNKTVFYDNALWGTPHIDRDYDQIRTNEITGLGRPIPDTNHGFIVMPGDVRGMILGERRWKDFPCPRHPEYTITGLCSDPFDSEIHRRTTLVSNCPACCHQSWLDT